MANGLISMQHRQTPAEARALIPKQSLKDQKRWILNHLLVLILFSFSHLFANLLSPINCSSRWKPPSRLWLTLARGTIWQHRKLLNQAERLKTSNQTAELIDFWQCVSNQRRSLYYILKCYCKKKKYIANSQTI